jgi:hypothetical protein
MTEPLQGDATAPQISTLKEILDERGLNTGAYARLRLAIARHELGDTMSKENASKSLGWLIQTVDSGRTDYWSTHDVVQTQQEAE